MTRYKLKQTIAIQTVGDFTIVKVLKSGTMFFNRKGFYYPVKNGAGLIVFAKADVENTPELFELVNENGFTIKSRKDSETTVCKE